MSSYVSAIASGGGAQPLDPAEFVNTAEISLDLLFQGDGESILETLNPSRVVPQLPQSTLNRRRATVVDLSHVDLLSLLLGQAVQHDVVTPGLFGGEPSAPPMIVPDRPTSQGMRLKPISASNDSWLSVSQAGQSGASSLNPVGEPIDLAEPFTDGSKITRFRGTPLASDRLIGEGIGDGLSIDLLQPTTQAPPFGSVDTSETSVPEPGMIAGLLAVGVLMIGRIAKRKVSNSRS